MQNFAIGLVVVHNQGALAGKRLFVADPSRAAQRLLLEADGEPESRAASRSAFDADAAPHHFDELPGDRQAQSRAAVPAGGRAVGLGEGLKEHPLHLRRDANPGVLDQEAQGYIALGLIHFFNLQNHLA